MGFVQRERNVKKMEALCVGFRGREGYSERGGRGQVCRDMEGFCERRNEEEEWQLGERERVDACNERERVEGRHKAFTCETARHCVPS